MDSSCVTQQRLFFFCFSMMNVKVASPGRLRPLVWSCSENPSYPFRLPSSTITRPNSSQRYTYYIYFFLSILFCLNVFLYITGGSFIGCWHRIHFRQSFRHSDSAYLPIGITNRAAISKRSLFFFFLVAALVTFCYFSFHFI